MCVSIYKTIEKGIEKRNKISSQILGKSRKRFIIFCSGVIRAGLGSIVINVSDCLDVVTMDIVKKIHHLHANVTLAIGLVRYAIVQNAETVNLRNMIDYTIYNIRKK